MRSKLSALMGRSGVLVMLSVLGLFCHGEASAEISCTYRGPSVSLSMSASSSAAPGNVTLTASSESGVEGNCTTIPVNGLRYTVNGTATGTYTTSPFTDSLTGLAPGTYSITAQAMNGTTVQVTSAAQTFTVNPYNQTISFGSLAGMAYGSAAFAVSASASSGLGVTFASSTSAACTVSGSTVSIVGTGTCSITASQAGNSSYSAAPSVTQSFTVSAASQSVSFAALSAKTYGAAAFTVSATSSSGLGVSFAASPSNVCTVSATTVTIAGTGTCSITASQAGNSDYAAASTTQSFTVSAAGQTVSFAALAAKTYGAAPFTVTATSSSGLGVSFAASPSNVCTVSGTTVNIAGAGTCSITASQSGNSDYTAASATQSFAVSPAAQTISFAAPAAKTYGMAPFAVSATSSSGLAVAFSASPASVCAVSGSTVTIAGAGSCSITASQAGNSNYTAATTVTQSFSVAQATQTISFAALSNQLMGVAPFTVSATSSANLAVAFTSATAAVCSVSGTTVTVVSTGTCTVNANQAGNSNYLAASTIAQSFAVNINPTVTVTGPTDGAAFAVSTAITLNANVTAGTYTLSGVSYYTSTGTLLCSTSASPWSCTDSSGLVAGSYSIYAVVSTSTSGVTATSAPITVTVGTGSGSPISSSTPIPVTITVPSTGNPTAGTLPGALSATVSGASAYSVPLALPPGVGGLAPLLELDYNSQSGNGMLGLGWSLGGMSSIHRCGKTIAQDNVTSGVNFTNTDRLCLDGQRLILLSVGSGATGNPDVDYWTVGATYSTEIANFSRITSYTGSKGLAFKVESKSGRILYYGDQGDGTSFIAAQGRTDGQAIVWGLGQVQDLSGNYYTISYTDSAAGEYLPSQIQYGGNNQTGLAAHLSVVFNYVTTRTDNTIRYIAGSHNDMVSLMSNIKVYNGLYSSGTATEIREYDLSYTSSASSGRTLMSSVQVQALNPQTNVLVAFPATTFAWNQSGSPAFSEVGSTAVSGPVAPYSSGSSPAIEFNNIIWADFNGDGKTDAMVVNTSVTPWQYNIYLAKAGGGFAAPIVWTVPTAIATTIASRKASESAAPYPFLSNVPANLGLNGWGLVGDFNGDGSSDLFLFGGYVCLSQLKTSPTAANAFSCTDSGTNTAATSGMGASLVSWNSQDYLVLNTTGSGLSDIVMRNGQYADGTRCVSTMTNGTQAFTCGVYTGTNYTITGVWNTSTTAPTTTDGVWVSNQLGNFSGSGRQDVYRSDAPTGGTGSNFMEVCTSGATGFTCSNWGAFPATVSNAVSGSGDLDANPQLQGTTNITDANGDGLSDVLLSGYVPQSGTGYDAAICYSTGVKFDCHTLTAASGNDTVIQNVGPIDSDGAVKTLAFEYNAAGTAGTWRTCIIKNNSNLSCQTISGGPTMPATPSSVTMPDPIVMFGGFLNDGTLNLLAYNESVDATGAKANNFTSGGTAWTPYTLAPNASTAADLLSSVTNGVGRISSVTYTQGGQASVYTQYSTNGNGTIYPIYPSVSVANPGYLVSAFYDSNGQGGSVETTYDFVSMLIDASGRGSLGFAGMGSYNLLSNVERQTYYRQNWPFVGMIDNTTTSHNYPSVQTLSTTQNDFADIALPNSYYSANPTMGGTETANCNVCFPYYLDSTTVKTDLNGNDLGTTVTNNISYDNFGNQLTSTVTSQLATDASAFVTTTTNTFDNDTGSCVASHGASYVIGRLCGTTISKTNEAGATITRTSANTYFATGLTQTETLEPNHTTLPSDDLQVTNTYSRDGYGNILTKVQSWIDPTSASMFSRTVSYTYTSDGRFPASSVNAMGQTETYGFDSATGTKTLYTDVNNLTTTWFVDGLGRIWAEGPANENVTMTYYNQCQNDCPPNATSVTVKIHNYYNASTNVSTQNGVPELIYTNPLGQVIRTMTYGFDGTPVITDHTFDARSRSLANYQPVFASGATASYPSGTLANQQTLDDLNRQLTNVTLDTSSAQLTTTTSYLGKTRTTVNPAGETRTETYDVLGELIGVQTSAFNNAPQTNTAFSYDPFGNLIQTTDPAGNNINVTYDAMGHKIQLNDPDLGIINYSVDPVGRTWKQVSPNEIANGAATTFQFDMLDRMISRIEPDLSSFFIYDVTGATGAPLTATQLSSCQSNHSCGKLVESYTASLSNGTNVGTINSTNTSKESDTIYNYDSLGRPANSTLTLDASLNMTFYSETDYDSWSRPITQIYQHGSDAQKVFDQRYNGYGYLQSVQRSGLTLWQATSQDAMNRVVTARLATAGGSSDGLVKTNCFDVNTGRLDNTVLASPGNTVACGSSPAVATFEESYSYDTLGNVQQRNEAWNQGISGTVASQSFSEGFTYDGLNRIVASTVANQAQQSYSYSVDGNILGNTAAGTYTYTGGTSGGPHAVKTVSGATTSFTYDADGNQLTGNSRSNTWTSFDMPLTLSYTGSGSQFTTNASQFTYGPNHERRTQLQGAAAIIYYGGEQEVQTDGSHNIQSIKTYWPMGLGVEIDTPTQAATVLNWTHTDHLGSVVAITDIDGNLKEALGYDTWGNRRNAVGAPVSIATTATAAVNESTDDKGYTDAEQIASLQLVHLNGRVYDPLIGKFLSGDPQVTDPKNGQNYNRYAYVLNNPMNATDPTGFDAVKLAWLNGVTVYGFMGSGGATSFNDNTVLAGVSIGSDGSLNFDSTATTTISDSGYVTSFSGSTPSSAGPADMSAPPASGATGAGVGNVGPSGATTVVGSATNTGTTTATPASTTPLIGSTPLSFTTTPADVWTTLGIPTPACCINLANSGGAMVPAPDPIQSVADPISLYYGGAMLRGAAAGASTLQTLFSDSTATPAPFSVYDTSATAPGSSALNVNTSTSSADAQSTLVSNGFSVTKQGTSTNGSYSVYSNGDSVYTFYTRTSTGDVGAQFFGSNGATLKINFPF